MTAPKDFEDYECEPYLVKCKCGELAEVTAITKKLANDGFGLDRTSYYIECLNCGRKGLISQHVGRADLERFVQTWTAIVEGHERFRNKNK